MSGAEITTCDGDWEEVPARPGVPASEAPEHLGFRQQKRMIRWLSPKELTHTAVRVFLSSIFGAYSDTREIQAALGDDRPVSNERCARTNEKREELWVDFVADLGDAFGPTYGVASLLARPTLVVGVAGGPPRANERGRVLIMGGDLRDGGSSESHASPARTSRPGSSRCPRTRCGPSSSSNRCGSSRPERCPRRSPG